MLGDFEIENLADNFNTCLKAEKQRWLVSESKENRDIPISKVIIIFLFAETDVNIILSLIHRLVVPIQFVDLMMRASVKSTVTTWL